MDEEAEVIRQQMEETRNSLQEKLETLEQQVTETVQGAVDAASETVQTVKETVRETVENVKETVDQTVTTVKDTFNLRKQVEEHPWAMFAGAVATGYLGTRLLYPASETPNYSPPPPSFRPAVPPPQATPQMHRNGTSPPVEKPGVFSRLADHFGNELAQVEGLALSVVASVVRDMLLSSSPPALVEQIKEIVDSVTTKLGGKPIEGSLGKSSTPCPPASELKEQPKDEPYAYRHEANMRMS